MVTTTLKVEYVEALGARLNMVKTVEMPYALRVGDLLCEGDPVSDEAIDLDVASAWYELQNSTLVVICTGAYDLAPGSLEPIRQALFEGGWMQELQMPA